MSEIALDNPFQQRHHYLLTFFKSVSRFNSLEYDCSGSVTKGNKIQR